MLPPNSACNSHTTRPAIMIGIKLGDGQGVEAGAGGVGGGGRGVCVGGVHFFFQFSSKLVSMRSKKPIGAPPRLSEVFPCVAFETVPMSN